jgi:hypothetical protein
VSPGDETTRCDHETSRRISIQSSGQLGEETKESNPIATIHFWIPERLSPSLNKRLAAIASSEDVLRLAVMPDVHDWKRLARISDAVSLPSNATVMRMG